MNSNTNTNSNTNSNTTTISAADPLAIYNPLTERIIGAAIEVHRALGPGLLESTYQACAAAEFLHQDIPFESQVRLPLVYRGVELDQAFRIDFVVDGRVIVELKVVEHLDPIFTAQILTYMKLTGHRVGLLINFNVPLLKKGIRRFVL